MLRSVRLLEAASTADAERAHLEMLLDQLGQERFGAALLPTWPVA